MEKQFSRAMEALVSALDLPEHAYLVLHVNLKSLIESLTDTHGNNASYRETTHTLLDALRTVSKPRGILVPSFTYSFTKTGRYNHALSPSEVGRFSEEVRLISGAEHRLVEPVFSFIDLDRTIDPDSYRYDSAFGEDSLFGTLSRLGVVSVNIGVHNLFGTYLHYIEAQHNVPYRYEKRFSGEISLDGEHWEHVDYVYHVRHLDKDTQWRRMRIAKDLIQRDALTERHFNGVTLRWCHSDQLDTVLGEYLRDDPCYLVRGALHDERVNWA